MSADELQQKWDQRYRQAARNKPQAARVLHDYQYLLPGEGDALELACGRGGNALLLAERGLQVTAWDLSPVAIAGLQEMAATQGVAIDASVRDVVAQPPLAAAFDVIVVSYFLERTLAPLICAALRPGGLLFYQTFVRDKVTGDGPNNAEFLLAENELLAMFSTLRLREYREEGSIGDPQQGLRNEALLVAQAPSA